MSKLISCPSIEINLALISEPLVACQLCSSSRATSSVTTVGFATIAGLGGGAGGLGAGVSGFGVGGLRQRQGGWRVTVTRLTNYSLVKEPFGHSTQL